MLGACSDVTAVENLYTHRAPLAISEIVGRAISDTVDMPEVPDYLRVGVIEVFYFAGPK